MMTQREPESKTWTSTSDGDYERLKGKTVYTSDDEEVGTITAIFHPTPAAKAPPDLPAPHYLLVDGSRLTGPGSADELYMPASAISGVEEDRITIAWPRDELENQGWGSRPEMIDEARRT